MQENLLLFSPMEKLRLSDDPAALAPFSGVTALRGEEAAFQAAVLGDGEFDVSVQAGSGVTVEVFRVGDVPCGMPAYPQPERHDADYIATETGLFPDVLFPLGNGKLTVGKRAVLWVSLHVAGDAPAGLQTVTLRVGGKTAEFALKIIPAKLPAQTLTFTQWFHVDCIALLHRVAVYSEAHWDLIGKYMRCAAEHGINMILTPVLTPALDTAVGGERPCTQLVNVTCTNGAYAFDFARLHRWVDLARESGIEKFEISHLFSQWGAKFAPNIYATVDGVYKRLFGWETPAAAPEYAAFLQALLPALLEEFKKLGVPGENLMFHISDEPEERDLEPYHAAKQIVEPLLTGYTVRDALSSFRLYTEGVVGNPIVSTDHITPFLEHDVPGLWTYYCCVQGVEVGNRFLAMPSYRNRILGVQFWKHRISGFLHWGFNFWFTQYSLAVIDPFQTTDAGGAFPGGDAFSVYPGEEGPLCSLRLKIFKMALQDLAALQLLESRIGYENTLELLGEGSGMSFSEYPRSVSYLPDLRERVNRRITETL